jgi:hypothetical protein
MAVPVTNAHANFLYYIAQQSLDFQEYSPARLIAVRDTHSPTGVWHNGGVAAVPFACVTDRHCNHSAFAYIVDHILNKPYDVKRADRDLLTQLSSFRVDTNLVDESGEEIRPDTIAVGLRLERRDSFNIKLHSAGQALLHPSRPHPLNRVDSEFSMIKSQPQFTKERYEKDGRTGFHYRLSFSGTILPPLDQQGECGREKDAGLIIEVNAPGRRPLATKVKLRAGWTSYVQLGLEKP